MFYGMGGTLQQADFTKRPTKITTTKEGVTAINFLGTPKEIGNQVFRRCPLLQSLEIPNGVQSVGQALFAEILEFTHPVSGERIRTKATLPEYFETFIKRSEKV